MDTKLAVVLLSGGLDSTTVLFWMLAQGYDVHALSFHYGQRHETELNAALKVCLAGGVKTHKIVSVPPILFEGTALTGGPEVHKDRSLEEMAGPELPNTFVPARNLVFISLAVAYAAKLGASALGLGVNALDYSGYPDCRPEFIAAMQEAVNLALTGQQHGAPDRSISLLTPLIHMTKAEIIRLAKQVGAPLDLTHSCYSPITQDGVSKACGCCDSCLLRQKGFKEAGEPDPTSYAYL